VDGRSADLSADVVLNVVVVLDVDFDGDGDVNMAAPR
jgi:hypothetical protein